MILGADSSYPIPAGAYKTSDQPAKNVRVTFGHSLSPNPAVELAIDLPEENLAGVNLTGKIIVTNTGNVALYRVPLILDSQFFQPETQSWEIAFLPPHGSASVDFTLPAAGWTSRFTDTLTAATDLNQTSRRLTITPAYRLVFGSQAFRLALFSFAALLVLKLIHARLVKAKPAV